jgi:hypothetical protein
MERADTTARQPAELDPPAGSARRPGLVSNEIPRSLRGAE